MPERRSRSPRRPRRDPGAPVMVDYYYRVKWGHQEEFIELFERNHWPLLKAGLDAGAFTDVRAYVPRFHGDGRADWTFLVTITHRDWAALTERGDPADFEKLFPDQDRYRTEERLRFELLDAHWDVALEEHRLPR